MFQLIVFIFDFGTGISCWGSFSITASVSVLFGVVCAALFWKLCNGGGGAGTVFEEGGAGTLGGGGGGGGNPGPKKESLIWI